MKIEIDNSLLKSLLILATVIEARDPYTGGHTWRVSQYSKLLAEKAGLNHNEAFLTQLGGLVHDLGKIGIPDSILNKKGKLDELEYTIMKKHPEIGENVIINHPLSSLVKISVTEHHERIDGNGYPNNIQNTELSTIGKIVAIADSFDAMTSTRSYRKGMPAEKAYEIINKNLNGQFDENFGNIFIETGKNGGLDHILNHSSEENLMLNCVVCGPVVAQNKNLHDGEDVSCPCCTGEFIAHTKGETFELEWKGTTTGIYVPGPDLDTVENVLVKAPKELKL